jgi:hypothetical protein
MAKSIQEITFNAVEAFWRSAMGDLGIPVDETGCYCGTAAEHLCELPCDKPRDEYYDGKTQDFEEFAEMLIRALAVQQARIDGDTAIDR